jgi:Second Messenger Oligonucleotide or Dinucleotide Synthetase domain
MLSVQDAFAKFKTRLEITKTQQDDAIRRHHEVRDLLREEMAFEDDFLTGSYARHTKTRPLRDVDVFMVLQNGDRSEPPLDSLTQMKEVLVKHYGEDCVTIDPPAVRVDFGGGADEDRVLSIEAVPAIAEGTNYAIPDPTRTSWMSSNPQRHAELATAANAACSQQWVPLVKMIKKWNDHQGQPLQPSFLVEVMALKLVAPPWVGGYAREIRQFFASASETIADSWPDPAGLGSAVTDELAVDPLLLQQARAALADAEAQATVAIRLDQSGRTSAALDAWQELFGSLFVKS